MNADLCPFHGQQVFEWQWNEYDARNPGEWPAGRNSGPHRFLLMDSRTSHGERSRHYAEKNRQQVELIVGICRSGRSPQRDR